MCRNKFSFSEASPSIQNQHKMRHSGKPKRSEVLVPDQRLHSTIEAVIFFLQ